jgi:glyoxylase-like metal-dependent hydrolase (beta-lactamase superfamily II)
VSRSIAVLLASAAIACHAPRPAITVGTGATRIDDELSVHRVAADAYVVTHDPFFSANTLVVRTSDGSVVIASSPFESQATRALVRWIRQALRPGRIIAINTHFHFDGTGGNAAFRELGVETYASTHTQALLLEHGPALRVQSAADQEDTARRRRVASLPIVGAEHTFAEQDGLRYALGEEVRVIYPGPAHSPDHVFVHFPGRGILFGGCSLRASTAIGFIGHADLARWSDALAAARATKATIVIPGHGKVGGRELFDVTQVMIDAARALPDGDHDGVPDKADRCPAVAATRVDADHWDGCPMKPRGGDIVGCGDLHQTIPFPEGSATIDDAAKARIGEVARRLQAHADMRRVAVVGSAAHEEDAQLFAARRDAVLEALVRAGVRRERLEAGPLAGPGDADVAFVVRSSDCRR